MTAQQELLEQRQVLQEVKINQMLVEDMFGTNCNIEVLISCIFEKLENLEQYTIHVLQNKFVEDIIRDIRQLTIITEQERVNNYKRIDTLLTQIENS